ncbi:low molecular weight phosphotyrosine protein phosphatase-like isoform X1 [Haliotis cracherodii]|uniref:low molecular weight phosphotyrosine protein phosphatase-like isoform X1 n=1 Tax=Haliotis cracherodii TaxID=6455 RepID=UPI0039ED2FBA
MHSGNVKMAAPTKKKSVLFICLGNICRSTMAEGIFQHLVKTNGLTDQWEIDSAALGDWHNGVPPDDRTMRTLKKNGITGYKHLGRQIKKADFHDFDVIFGMDEDNMSELDEIKPKSCRSKLLMLGECDPEGELIIEDPYYGNNIKDFEKVYEQCHRACNHFLQNSDKFLSS